MKATTEQLLNDLLADAAPADFRGALMDQTLRSARQRQRGKKLNAALGAVAVIGILLLSVFRTRPVSPQPDVAARPDPLYVFSQPLRPGQIVLTQNHAVAEIASSASTVVMVQTSSSTGHYQLIDDRQLLALLSDKSAILIHHGKHQAELVFPDSGD